MRLAPRRHHDKPDVETARANLERVRAQREQIEALADYLVHDEQMNNYTANLVALYRGGN